jgi:hypothetical protein
VSQVLAFHPKCPDLLLSADKTGELCVTNMAKKFEQKQLVPHHWLISGIVPDPGTPGLWAYTCSEDGSIKHVDLTSGITEEVCVCLCLCVYVCVCPRCCSALCTHTALCGCSQCLALPYASTQVSNLNPGGWDGDYDAINHYHCLAGFTDSRGVALLYAGSVRRYPATTHVSGLMAHVA